MNEIEFLAEFDLLYNNISSNKAPGLNSYEISVYLTKAQEQLLKNYFEPLGNKYRKGFDDSPKRQIDFSSLIEEADSHNKGGITRINNNIGLTNRIKSFLLPNNILFILNEVAYIQKGKTILETQVIPIHYNEYTRLMSKSYKEPLKFQTWRLTAEGSINDMVRSDLIVKTGFDIREYAIRYIRRPKPIIISDFSEEFGEEITINGYNKPIKTINGSICELNPEIHREIIDRAVELAISSYEGNLGNKIEINQRNE